MCRSPKKDPNKFRIICVPTFQDRLVQKALLNFIEPRSTSLGIANDVSFGFVKTSPGNKRGVVAARAAAIDPASFFEKKQAIDNATKVAIFGTLYWAHLRLGWLNGPKFYCVRGGFRR